MCIQLSEVQTLLRDQPQKNTRPFNALTFTFLFYFTKKIIIFHYNGEQKRTNFFFLQMILYGARGGKRVCSIETGGERRREWWCGGQAAIAIQSRTHDEGNGTNKVLMVLCERSELICLLVELCFVVVVVVLRSRLCACATSLTAGDARDIFSCCCALNAYCTKKKLHYTIYTTHSFYIRKFRCFIVCG